MEDVKTLIRSILISSPLQLAIWKLDKDYEELNGERIPYQKHGFKSLEHLLRNIPDIVKVCGTGPHAKLEVLVTNKSAHIDKLISKQRVKVPARKKVFQRRSRYPQHYEASFHQQRIRPLMYYPPFVPMHNAAFNFQHMPRQRQFYVPPPHHAFDTRNEDRGGMSTPNNRSFPSPNNSFPSPNNSFPLPNNKSFPSPSNSFPSPNNKSFPSPIPPVNSDTSKQNVFYNKSVEPPADVKKSDNKTSLGAIPKTKTVADQYIFRESSESEVYISDHEIYISDNEDYVKPNDSQFPQFPADDKNINENVPLTVQRNLKQLIGQFDEGVWCAEVPKIYMNMFNKPLDYLEYGYMSLSTMCKDLDYIFHCHRPGSADFLLFDRSKPVPQNVLRKAEAAAQSNFSFEQESDTYGQPALLDVEDLCEEISFEYPVDVIEFGEEIPRQFIPDGVREYDFIDVVVGEVYDPSKFWILLKEHADSLDALMDEMQSFYLKHLDELKVPKHMIKVGLYCAAKYNREYHRAVIVKMLQAENKVKVYYIDYGTVSTVATDGLLFLHKNFSSLHQQAIRARLANIWPKTSYSYWPLSASSRFLELVKFKDLVAHIYQIDRDKKMLEIFLADTSTDDDIYMNDTLVAEGYALFTDTDQEAPQQLMQIPIYKHIHLYPTFEELENSDFPSSTELTRLYKCGMTNDFIFARYYIAKNNLLTNHSSIPKEDKCTSAEINSSTEDIPKDTSAQGWWKKRCKEAENAKAEENDDDIPEVMKSYNVDDNIHRSPSSNESLFKVEIPAHLNPPSPILPPPGFKPLQHPFETAHSISGMMPPQPLVSTNQPINFITQLLIDPAVLQNQKLPQAVPNVYRPPDVQVSAEARKQLQEFIYKRIISGNRLLLMNFANVVWFNHRQMALLKVIEEVIVSQRINTLSIEHIDSIIKELLVSLSERQLIELASKQIDFENRSQDFPVFNAAAAAPVNHDLINKMQNMSLHESHDEETNKSTKKHIVRTMLGSNTVHVINFLNSLFMPVSDVLQFSTVTIPIDAVRKLVVLIDPNSSVIDIPVNDHKHLEKELHAYKIFDKVLHILPVQIVPLVANALGHTGTSFNNYEKFLKGIRLKSDIWFKH